MNLLSTVRERCAAVATQSAWVEIDYERLPAYADELPYDRPRTTRLDPSLHYLDGGEDTLAFLLTLGAVRFGADGPHGIEPLFGLSGSQTVALRLTQQFRRHGPLSARRLTELGPADCAALFGQERPGRAGGPLMERYAQALNDLGRLLLDQYHGSFVRLVEMADHSAERLVEQLIVMPCFADVHHYDALHEGFWVPFYTRAQGVVGDLALAFRGARWGRFDDLQALTLRAGSRLPAVLRRDGILRYQPELAGAVDSRRVLMSGSPQEVELRACTVHVGELLAEHLRRAHGRDWSTIVLDHLLWNRSQAWPDTRESGGARDDAQVLAPHRAWTVHY